MANKTYAVHTSESNIERLDEHANRIRRSRNSLMNEAIEAILEELDADVLKATRLKKLPRNCKPCDGTGIFTEAGIRRTCNSCYGTGFNEDEVATTTKPKKKAGAR